jgi:ABC-type dipeptide/oligopeptide/nickel transport system ATPase component
MVGESGFGRSVTMLSILGMIPDPSGKGTWGKCYSNRETATADPRKSNFAC